LAAFAILQNEADAEDVSQEAVLKALSHLHQFRSEAKFSTWLIQICVNEAKMRLRRDRKDRYESIDRGQEGEEGDHVPIDVADWREIPSEALARKELRDALARGLASLKPQYREVFVLRDVQGLNIEETAQVLGISKATVKMRLLRARLQMRDSLAPGFDGSWSQGEKTYRPVRSASFY
jgi:RNA polymerase sigma-70 factor (ECF subfamily)